MVFLRCPPSTARRIFHVRYAISEYRKELTSILVSGDNFCSGKSTDVVSDELSKMFSEVAERYGILI